MSDFEDRLARALADPSQAPDESFVANVADRVGAEERARMIRLSIATLAMLALVLTFGYGLALALSASGVPMVIQQMLKAAGASVCIFVALLSLPLAFVRD